MDALHLRSSLLLERKEHTFSFPHRTFQEYLAGVHLARKADFDQLAAEWAVGSSIFWREVILLAVGYLVHDQRDTGKPRLLIEALCPESGPTDDEQWRKIWLAGDVLLEIGTNRISDTEHGKKLLARVVTRLTELIEDGQLSARERAEVGDTLGQLGDPRFDPQFFYLPYRYRGEPEALAGFVKIEKGPFVMGSREDDKEADDDEYGNPKILRIDYDDWIARYPVTVAQYAAFIEEGGEKPDEWSRQESFENRAVMDVSGYQARAYCEWLDGTLRKAQRFVEWFDKGYSITLPTEAEWEKAARSADSRRYPWGYADWDERRANIGQSDINRVTVVGMYPHGMTPTGLHDMSGNVWEWTQSVYREYPYKPGKESNDSQLEGNRVVRGGSWANYLGLARCAGRNHSHPAYALSVNGFRVFLSLAEF